jgi:hypothetical protein
VVSLAEIKQAIDRLRPEEQTALTAFLVRRDNAAWDQQIENDAATGKLDVLFDEAEQEGDDQKLRDWPAR